MQHLVAENAGTKCTFLWGGHAVHDRMYFLDVDVSVAAGLSELIFIYYVDDLG